MPDEERMLARPGRRHQKRETPPQERGTLNVQQNLAPARALWHFTDTAPWFTHGAVLAQM